MINDGILDYVAVDLKHSMHMYDEAVWLAQPSEFYNSYQKLLQLLIESGVDYEYRTTVVKWLHTADDIENMAYYIRWAKNYYLQNYVWWNTLDPEFGGEPFSDDELFEFQKIAQRYVKNVGIRK